MLWYNNCLSTISPRLPSKHSQCFVWLKTDQQDSDSSFNFWSRWHHAAQKAHTSSAPSINSLPKVALKTVSVFVWLRQINQTVIAASVSHQDGIMQLKRPIHALIQQLSVNNLPKVALKTFLMFVWLKTDQQDSDSSFSFWSRWHHAAQKAHTCSDTIIVCQQSPQRCPQNIVNVCLAEHRSTMQVKRPICVLPCLSTIS